MKPEVSIQSEMEELRRQLHQGLGSGYDPERLQRLHAISSEFDRLAVQLTRREEEKEQVAAAR